MRKKNIYKFLYVACICLVVLFGIRTGVDYLHYDARATSFPFYVVIIEGIFEFIIPSIILFVVARILKQYYNK